MTTTEDLMHIPFATPHQGYPPVFSESDQMMILPQQQLRG
jgi:hypothetical protein